MVRLIFDEKKKTNKTQNTKILESVNGCSFDPTNIRRVALSCGQRKFSSIGEGKEKKNKHKITKTNTNINTYEEESNNTITSQSHDRNQNPLLSIWNLEE